MIGQSTVITNQHVGEEYFSISHPFVALHVLQQHRHVTLLMTNFCNFRNYNNC